MKSINEHITTLLKNEEKESIKNKEMIFSEIIFKNVNYEYRSNKKVFDSDISIKLEHNKKYLIIGESGRGKSTLVKILMKYLKNYKGSIKINGIELNELHDNDINENIFYIPQNLYIFNESINDNLNIKKKHSEKKVVEVLKYMNLEKIIKDEGLDTVIGQEINSVSGGKAARIYIAKLKLSDKNIVIADEILSNLDKKNSMNVEQTLINIKYMYII